MLGEKKGHENNNNNNNKKHGATLENEEWSVVLAANLNRMVREAWWSEASLVAQRVKRLPAMWDTWVQSLGWEDPLEKEMATHSSSLAWDIPWMEAPGRLQSMGLQRVGHDWQNSCREASLRKPWSKNFKRYEVNTAIKWSSRTRAQ